MEHTEWNESFKSLPLHNPFSMALPHSTRGVLVLDTRRGTTGIIYASSILCVYSASVFCVWMWACCVCGGFSSSWDSAGPLHPSWASISLLDTHQWGEAESLGVSWAPRVLQALRRSRMTLNQGSGAWAAAGGPQEPWLYESPQVTPPAGRPPWARTLRSLRPDEALCASMRGTFMMKP